MTPARCSWRAPPPPLLPPPLSPAPAYSQHAPAPASPQLSTTYSHAPAPAPVYSQSLAQAHEMSLGAHNVYHLVRPDHLQNIPSGDYLNMFKYF